eukprot:CAMPEP_0113937070 /NCGR_PEP_ID=MMETSP1339-20121228/3773_1 /TAXON_ID=94617 /ORGANISM="Fibrocapsa japonica" /LENGTH=256 /DNA_ID=CAMNT_0000939703 /DNA_START=57 /DNA_END=827 /DNA_ORIENTATION=+ /assembly_acc=CAM_ASM_000762
MASAPTILCLLLVLVANCSAFRSFFPAVTRPQTRIYARGDRDITKIDESDAFARLLQTLEEEEALEQTEQKPAKTPVIKTPEDVREVLKPRAPVQEQPPAPAPVTAPAPAPVKPQVPVAKTAVAPTPTSPSKDAVVVKPKVEVQEEEATPMGAILKGAALPGGLALGGVPLVLAVGRQYMMKRRVAEAEMEKASQLEVAAMKASAARLKQLKLDGKRMEEEAAARETESAVEKTETVVDDKPKPFQFGNSWSTFWW